MLDPPTHNRPFADKRNKVGMDGVPKQPATNTFSKITFTIEILHRLATFIFFDSKSNPSCVRLLSEVSSSKRAASIANLSKSVRLLIKGRL